MHSPEVLAFSIKRPWPRVTKRRDTPVNDARGKFHYRWGSSFMYVGKYELYFPSMIDVWHMEPGGADALTVCRDVYKDKNGKWHYPQTWKWHFWHYKISWSFIYGWRRKLFTRCAECGGPSRKGHVVNVSAGGWDGAPKTPLWCGEIKLYHSDCYAQVSRQHHMHDPANCYNCKERQYKEAGIPPANSKLPIRKGV